ncbi:MAG: hypothetical protein ABI051_16120 [Vicinamibacterales bacterium]
MIVERPALERRVMQSLDAGRIPVILGGCGSGLTSLLLRLEQTLGPGRAQYLDMAAAATTPERCLAAVLAVSRLRGTSGTSTDAGAGTDRAFVALLDYFDAASDADQPATFLLDEFLDVRTFESFPGLRHVQLDLITRLAASRTRFVLTSRFTARVHRLLRDAPARFEVIHIAPLDDAEVESLLEHMSRGRRLRMGDTAAVVSALTGGHAGTAHLLLAAVGSSDAAVDVTRAMAHGFAPDGALTAHWRGCYEFRLHRARGYGALKAILGILAETEGLTLTHIAHHLQRTPGSTKDYLSWLEDVDLIVMHGKRYSYTEPLLRLFVRLYGKPVPPSADDVRREVADYARPRLPASRTHAGAGAPAVEPAADPSRSGIIEID